MFIKKLRESYESRGTLILESLAGLTYYFQHSY